MKFRGRTQLLNLMNGVLSLKLLGRVAAVSDLKLEAVVTASPGGSSSGGFDQGRSDYH